VTLAEDVPRVATGQGSHKYRILIVSYSLFLFGYRFIKLPKQHTMAGGKMFTNFGEI
jgi:hypothetical protein